MEKSVTKSGQSGVKAAEAGGASAKLEKAKKQAKNLLRLAKAEGGALAVNNLNEAQDWVARMGGYPDWRSMAARLKRETEDMEARSAGAALAVASAFGGQAGPSQRAAGHAQDQEGSRIPFRLLGAVPVFDLGSEVGTAFDLSGMPLESGKETQKYVSSLLEACMMRWNTDFHRLAVMFWQEEKDAAGQDELRLLPARPAMGLGVERWEEFFGARGVAGQSGGGLRGALVLLTGREFEEEHEALAGLAAGWLAPERGICSEALANFVAGLERAGEAFAGNAPGADRGGAAGDPSPNFEVCVDGRGRLLLSDASALFKLRAGMKAGGDLHPCAVNVNWLHGLAALASKGVPFAASALVEPGRSEAWIRVPEGSEGRLSRGYVAGLVNSLRRQVYGAEEGFSGVPVKLVGVSRPAGLQVKGALLAQSALGRAPMPLSPDDGQQTSRVKLLVGAAGCGKSTLMDLLKIRSAFFESENGKVPPMFGLGTGAAGKAAAAFLGRALPKGPMGVAQARWRSAGEPDFHANPFETELGCRRPTGLHMELVVRLLALLASWRGAEGSAEPGVMGAWAAAAKMAYGKLSDGETPNIYAQGQDAEVDAALAELGFVPGRSQAWWGVVDALMEAGKERQARLAQRRAAPVLSDFALALGSEPVKSLYGMVELSSTGEGMLAAIRRELEAAMSAFPHLNRAGKADFGDGVEFVALDGEGRGSDAVAWLVWAIAGVKSVGLDMACAALNQEGLGLPEAGRRFYAAKLAQRRRKGVQGLLHFDGLEEALGNGHVSSALASIAKEARKYGFEAAFASDWLPPSVTQGSGMGRFRDLAELATTAVCSAAGSGRRVAAGSEIRDRRVKACLERLEDSGAGGGLWYVKHSTALGVREDMVSMPLPAALRWLLPQRREDVELAEALAASGASREEAAVALASASAAGEPAPAGELDVVALAEAQKRRESIRRGSGDGCHSGG